MEKSKIVYKNSAKNEFAVNLLIIVIAGLLTFMAAKFFNDKFAIVIYAISIAVSYCRIAIEAVERVLAKKFSADIITTVAILVIFASQKFLVAAIISLIYALSKSLFDLINSFLSDKLVKDEKLMASYTVVNGNEEKETLLEDISSGDSIKVARGDYLAFSYEFTNGSGLTKSYKPGKFNACDSGIVTVLEIDNYDIDFEFTYDNLDKSKLDKKADFIVLIYTIAAVFLALAMFVMKIIGGGVVEALYTLGVYLLFACPLSVNSGNIVSGLLLYRSLRLNGVNVENKQDIEDLGNAKDIFLSEEVVFDDDKINSNTVKALKTAEVVKLNAYLIGKDEEKCKKAVKVASFKDYKIANDEEECKSILEEQTKKNTAVFVSENSVEKIKNTVDFSCSCKTERNIDKKDLFSLVKEIKNCRFYKLFIYLRTAVGIVINFLVAGVFASGKLDSILSNKLLESDAVGEDTVGIMNKLLSVLIYNDKLAPWLIAVCHLLLINVLILFVQLLLNDNKKLR